MARPTGFLEFPPNAELTGEYSGVVQNLTAGQSADFTILVSESKAAEPFKDAWR